MPAARPRSTDRSDTSLFVHSPPAGLCRPARARLTCWLRSGPFSLTCAENVVATSSSTRGVLSDLYAVPERRCPEFELFELGHVHALRRLLATHGLPFGGKVHVDFVLGVPGAMPGTPAALLAGVAMLPEEVTSWSATGIGRTHLPVLAAALAAGGHLRVGMEDNVVFARGQEVRHNVELVTRAASCDDDAAPADVDDAGPRVLGVKPRRP